MKLMCLLSEWLVFRDFFKAQRPALGRHQNGRRSGCDAAPEFDEVEKIDFSYSYLYNQNVLLGK